MTINIMIAFFFLSFIVALRPDIIACNYLIINVSESNCHSIVLDGCLRLIKRKVAFRTDGKLRIVTLWWLPVSYIKNGTPRG